MKKILSLLCLLVLPLAADQFTWSTPVQLSSSGVNSSDARLAIDTAGNGAVAWVENGFIKSSSHPAGGSWSASTLISGSGASEPQLVAAPSTGKLTLIWLENGALKTASKVLGSAWSTATTLSATGATETSLSVDNVGNVVVVWTSSGAIQSLTKLVAGTWPASADVLASSGTTPQVAISANGTVLAAWHAINAVSSIDAIYAAEKSISGSWGTPQSISSTSQSSVNPRVAIDDNGNALVSWFTFQTTAGQYNNVLVEVSLLSGNTYTWTTPLVISQPGVINPMLLRMKLGFSSSGVGFAYWLSSADGLVYAINSAVLPISGDWMGKSTVAYDSLPLTTGMDHTSIGDAFIAYSSIDPATQTLDILTQESSFSGVFAGSWINQQIVTSQATQNANPRIAVSNNGIASNNGVVAWQNYDGSYVLIKASVGTALLLQPPSNAAVSQGSTFYGVFTEYHNVISWSPSISLGTTNYIIYRNGIMIAELDSSITSFTDGNRILGVSDNYLISALSTQTGEQSSFLTITY